MPLNRSLSLHQVRADWLRVQGEVAWVRMLLAGQQYFEALQREQRFNPNHDDRGRFTFGDGQDAVVGGQGNDQLAQNVPRGSSRAVRVGARDLTMTLEQETRFIFSQNRLDAALVRVREVDPNWQSSARPSLTDPANAETAINSNLRLAQEAEARATVIERGGLPLGFNTRQDFEKFGAEAMRGLVSSGHKDAIPFIRGSAVTGYSYRQGEVFDVGRRSDFDLAIVSPKLLQRAREVGIELRGGETRTRELNPLDLKSLGLDGLAASLVDQSGHDTTLMIYSSESAVQARGPYLTVP